MQSQLRASGILVITMMMCAASTTPTSAQITSRSSQITLMAIMPERLSLRVNTSDPGYVALAFQDKATAGIATTVSTAWSLQPGRANVVTRAFYKTNAPVLLALASLPGSVPVVAGPWPDSLPNEFPIRLPASSMPVDAVVITPARRVGENTASLPSNGPMQVLSPPLDASTGTLKIQVQPVL